jgi:uncharacterized protein (TIRG00374 family)
MRKSSVIQLSAGVALAGGSLYIFFRSVKPKALVHHLAATPPWIIVAAIGLTLLTLWLRSMRWGLILPASKGNRHGLFGLLMIGFMVNNFLPARLGEVTRALFLWKRNGFTIAESAGSVIIERVLDSIVYLSFFCIPILWLPRLRAELLLAIPVAAGSAAAVLALICYAVFPAATARFCKYLVKYLPVKVQEKVVATGKELVSNLQWVFSPVQCLLMIASSFLIVACYACMMILLVHEEGFGFLPGMFGAAWGAIGAAIPFSPGYVGTLHVALQKGLGLLGIDAARASSVAVLYHGIGYLTVTVAGLYFFVRMGISFKEIGRAKEELKKEEAAEK